MIMSFAALYEIRDAIAAHLGEAKAKELKIEIKYAAHFDAMEVRIPTVATFAISRRDLEEGPDAWKKVLRTKLDALIAANGEQHEPDSVTPASA